MQRSNERNPKMTETDMRRKTGHRTSGQVMAEYVLMLVMFVMASVALLFLLAALSGYGWRSLMLVLWEPLT